MRRATPKHINHVSNLLNFYPRSPCGERLSKRRLPSSCRRFLSTLSLRRATYVFETGLHSCNDFYPRSPCGERLARCRCWVLSNAISIHALLAESDPEQLRTVRVSSSQDFYPRSPCGERPISTVLLLPPTKFLSTLSLRRATRHSPIFRYRQEPFLSTLSLRRATQSGPRWRGPVSISIHALLAESDRSTGQRPQQGSISIHALLAESD